MTDGLLIVNN